MLRTSISTGPFSTLLILSTLVLAASTAAAAPAPATILYAPDDLVRVRSAVGRQDPTMQPPLAALLGAADSELSRGPWSVTASASLKPPGASARDYASLGSYWWPCTAPCNTTLFENCSLWTHSDLGPPGPPYKNCSKSTGLPWYDHDGYHNPLGDKLDGPALDHMAEAVTNLALASFLLAPTNSTRAAAYAAHAELVLDTWFLNQSTGMLPNGDFAQGIPGRCHGRGIGIIDFDQTIPAALDAARLLAAATTESYQFSSRMASGLDAWAAQWLEWLVSSDNGKDEASQLNNHGTWYDTLAVVTAAGLKNFTIVEKVCAAAPSKRIAVQVAPTGALPLEDKRTKSQSYHAYDAQALLRLAQLCQRFSSTSVDLFTYETEDGRGLAKMMTWLSPYAEVPPAKPWPFKQVEHFDPLAYTSVFRAAAKASEWARDAEAYERIAEAQPGAASALVNLLYPYWHA